MPKQQLLWITNDDEVFDTEAEAAEHEAREEFKQYARMDEHELSILHNILDDVEFAQKFVKYGNARARAKKEIEKQNERPKDIQEALDAGKA